ncbi:MAG: ISAzo13 family transposase [Actinobacteria bacterium]|nr:ISAzo13 family transposase [Actinomycetota bacterium]MCA1698906.1 ISAzo13 family transposase [Actinomycetota bacterium]
MPDIDEDAIAQRWVYMIGRASLDERQRRLWAASEALSHGRGGIAAVARATGLAQTTVRDGIKDLRSDEQWQAGQQRRAGAGRPSLVERDETLIGDLEGLLEPATRGDPESLLKWTNKSAATLAGELRALGHEIVDRSVLRLSDQLGFTMQANRKTREGADHPDRDAQFQYIDQVAKAALAACEPVISVDTKKKELIGNFKAVGRERAPKGEPVQVNTHDFPSHALGKAVPYGVLDLAVDEGHVSVGVSADTAQFAAASILAWWRQLGAERYPNATRLTITADSGGSNSARGRLWKSELQRLADITGLEICVLHYPPGTSKWNRIEHRLFSQISINWRGRPLTSYQTIISLIAATTTTTGLKVYCRLDEGAYQTGIKITNKQIAAVNLHRHDFHGDWNYTIKPTPTPHED